MATSSRSWKEDEKRKKKSGAKKWKGKIKWSYHTTSILVVAVYLLGQLIVLALNERIANAGIRVKQMEDIKELLRIENSELEVRIASESSLRVVAKKAKGLGFQPIKGVQFYGH